MKKEYNINQKLTLIAIPFIIICGIIALIASRQLVDTIKIKKVKYYCKNGYKLNNNMCEKEITKDSYSIGDINMDNSIDIIDYTTLNNYINNKTNLDDYQLILADINNDNSVDIIDANILNNYLNNINTKSSIGNKVCPDNYTLKNTKCITKEIIKAKKK